MKSDVNKVNKLLSGPKKGFLLLEVSISILVFTGISIALMSWYTNIVKKQSRSIKKAKALFCACNLLEQVRAERRVPLEINSFNGFSIKWLKKELDLPNFILVTVIVSWLDETDQADQIDQIGSKEIKLSTGTLIKKVKK